MNVLKGYRTYISGALALVLLLAHYNKWFVVPPELIAACGIVMLGFLRAGGKNDGGNVSGVIALACLLPLFTGCAFRVAPGADPVVVYAEATSETALDAFDTFLKWERNNEATLTTVNPGIHKAADALRDNGKRWIEELNTAIRSYKRSRTPETKTALLAAQEFIELALAECRYWTIQGKAK